VLRTMPGSPPIAPTPKWARGVGEMTSSEIMARPCDRDR
jgi:hypothetical protein